jgi:hypothetical protein
MIRLFSNTHGLISRGEIPEVDIVRCLIISQSKAGASGDKL